MPNKDKKNALGDGQQAAPKASANYQALVELLKSQVQMMQNDIVRGQKWRSLSIRVMHPWQIEQVKAKMFEWENEQEKTE